MKKSLLAMTALAAMLFAGCTSSDELTTLESIKQAENAPTPISFGTYMGRTGTRSGTNGQINTDALKTGSHKTDGFGVFAYNTGTSTWSTVHTTAKPDFMYNQQVTWDGASKWGYTPLKYWPNGIDAGNTSGNPSKTAQSSVQNLSFFAYAPWVSVTPNTGVPDETTKGITALTTNAISGHPKVTYRYSFTTGPVYDLGTTNNIDLLWGTRTTSSYNETDNSVSSKPGPDTKGNSYNVDLTKQTTTETIDFTFKHALAKFGGYETASGIKVVGDFDGNNTTNPQTAGLAGNYDATTLITLKSITISNISTTNTPNGGEFDLTTGTWTANSEKISFSKTYSDASSNSFLNSDVWEPASVTTYPWSIGGITGTVKDVFSGTTDALYFVPRITDQKIKIEVQYTVRTYDPNLAAPTGETVTCSKVVQTITNEVDISGLLENHYYTLVIHLGMTSVKFTAEVSGWTTADGENNVIWLPSNVVGS